VRKIGFALRRRAGEDAATPSPTPKPLALSAALDLDGVGRTYVLKHNPPGDRRDFAAGSAS